MVLVDERTRAIVLANAHGLALEQLAIELQHALWKAPEKNADKLEAFEARLALVREGVYAVLMSPYGEQPAAAAPTKSADARPVPAAPPAKPGKTKAPSKPAPAVEAPPAAADDAGDVSDDLDAADPFA
jgi:hypothetical protein